MMGGWAANRKTDRRSFGVFQRRLGYLALCARSFGGKVRRGGILALEGWSIEQVGRYVNTFDLSNSVI